jgi:hypothetical protein
MWRCVVRCVVLNILTTLASEMWCCVIRQLVLNILRILASGMWFCVIRHILLNILSTLASGMWCCVIQQLVLNILSIWGIQDVMLCHQMSGSQHSEDITSGSTHQMTQHHIPEDVNPQMNINSNHIRLIVPYFMRTNCSSKCQQKICFWKMRPDTFLSAI